MNTTQWAKTIKQFERLDKLNNHENLKVTWYGHIVSQFYIYKNEVNISLKSAASLHIDSDDKFTPPFECFTIEEHKYKDVTKKYLK